MAKLRFKKGDLVELDPLRCPIWIRAGYSEGIIFSSEPYKAYPRDSADAGYGNKGSPFGPNWKIQLVDFNYNNSDNNWHYVSDDAITLVVTEDDVKEAIESIIRSAS